MARPAIYLILIALFLGYSLVVYTKATESSIIPTPAEQKKISMGKALYQQYNCQSCHQIFGLGGYLGTDLTNAWSDPARGENMMRALLRSGGSRMPDFSFTSEQTESILAYLKYTDATSTADKARN
jgi:nitric oxide reductase subunit C